MIENGDLRVRDCRYGLMLYSVLDTYVGRSLDAYGEYCEQEVYLYKQLVLPGQTILDAGANIGAHTVFFAGAVGSDGLVHAFEPQRFLFQMLCANLALNRLQNVRAHHVAVGGTAGSITVPEVDYSIEDNFGGLSLTDRGPGETVPLITIDGLDLDRCHLIKADVEGMEGEVLKGAERTIERFRPILYIENNRKERSSPLIGQLFDMGYRLFWHLPKLYNPQNLFGLTRNLFGETVNINMLCLPGGDDRDVQLQQITSPGDW